MQKEVVVGSKFTRWEVVSEKYVRGTGVYVNCLCSCGTQRPVLVTSLTRKDKVSRSCGCLAKEDATGKIKNPLQIDQRFGRLVVTGEGYVAAGTAMYPVLCDCGVVKSVRKHALVSGITKSCGCLSAELSGQRKSNLQHGMAGTTEHNAWLSMKRRCYLETDAAYEHYGKRGIKVCDRWLESFQNFYADMRDRPGPDMSVERLDVNGDYTPENCVWADRTAQMFNRRKFKDCSSKYIGVCYEDGRNKPWRVSLKKNNKVVFSGSYRTEEEAARAYDAASLEHYGVKRNFVDKEEDESI